MLTDGENPKNYLLTALTTAKDGKYKKYTSMILAGLAFYEVGQQLKNKTKRDYAHSVNVIEDDEIYGDIQAWLIQNIPAKKRRSLSARSFRDNSETLSYAPWDPRSRVEEQKRRQGRLVLFYDGSREQTVRVNGHRIRVSVSREDVALGGGMKREREKITFTAATAEAREAVIEFLRDLAIAKHEDGHSRLFIANTWGDWTLQDRPPRHLDTVVLPAEVKKRLVDDLGRFLAHEDEYVEHGIPWHRGYLFHGPPGTGKTSLAKALAEHFEMDVYYIPLSDLTKDSELGSLFSSVSKKSILILEDVDIVHATKSRDDAESPGVSLSGILNALDGMITPHGLVTIMTTNDIDALDPALKRAGRADVVQELGYLTNAELGELLKMLLKETIKTYPNVTGKQITHAEVMESVKKVIGDKKAMRASVMGMLEEATK